MVEPIARFRERCAAASGDSGRVSVTLTLAKPEESPAVIAMLLTLYAEVAPGTPLPAAWAYDKEAAYLLSRAGDGIWTLRSMIGGVRGDAYSNDIALLLPDDARIECEVLEDCWQPEITFTVSARDREAVDRVVTALRGIMARSGWAGADR